LPLKTIMCFLEPVRQRLLWTSLKFIDTHHLRYYLPYIWVIWFCRSLYVAL
jgi:hypothetical protein